MKYAAFFRGVNVGGKNIVKMAELKQVFLDCGCSNVQTCLQSGNVLFASDQSPAQLESAVSPAFSARFGFPSRFTLRTSEEVETILRDLPFTQEEIDRTENSHPDVEHVYVYLSDHELDPSALDVIRRFNAGPDRFASTSKEIYLLCAESIRNSKLAARLSKVDETLTSRNLKTMRKINDILSAF